ncbi:MAG: dicarboxylate/amino acid:cation symporter [Holosporales bacterium]|jgi:proton glutamate symport protein|nr:dicarboxylate/amino acid:cation symporter [Holosporales bacterium]
MKKTAFGKILGSPIFLLLCISCGIYAGFCQQHLAPMLKPVAIFYSNLLQIAVIPIISITIISSMTKLLSHKSSDSYISTILGTFVSMILFAGVVAVLTGHIMQPGKNMSSDPEIVKIVEKSGGGKVREITLDDPIEKSQAISIVDFLVDTVPHNIFKSLSTANMLQIIVFCLMFSIACGMVSRQDKKVRLLFLGDMLPVFHKINEKVLLFLPIGSFCLLTTQLSTTSKSTFFTILSLAVTMLTAIFALIVISSIILWKCSRMKYFDTVKGLFDTLLMGFSTQSSIICVPKAVNAMSDILKFDRQTVELTIPLGVPLCQFATVCFYSIGSIFVINIFNEHLTLYSYIFIIFASILTSLAASGVRGMLYYSLMTSILDPLGVPLGSTVALFAAVDPLVDPFCTMLQLYANCCSAAVCCRVSERRKRKRALAGGDSQIEGDAQAALENQANGTKTQALLEAKTSGANTLAAETLNADGAAQADNAGGAAEADNATVVAKNADAATAAEADNASTNGPKRKPGRPKKGDK